MDSQQKQVMESFARVRDFVDAYPATGRLTYASAREMLDDVVRRLREHAGAQVSGQDLSRAEVQKQKDQIAALLDDHMRPLVTTARAQIEPRSDVRLPAALRMPRHALSATNALAACDGMIEAARPFEAVLIANGLPADFLTQFASARDALERTMAGKAAQVRTRVAAAAGLQVELVRGRRAVDRLDAIVRTTYRGDQVALAAWRQARRVQKAPGGSGPRAADPATALTSASGPVAPLAEAA